MKKATKKAKRLTKKEIFALYGILYDNKTDKIFHDVLGWINLLLINGNEKIGKGVWHFSTLPTKKIFHDVQIAENVIVDLQGTCPCSCADCYATKGNYQWHTTIESLGMRTWLVYNDLNFVENAIKAQIKANKIKLCRIHASGDFFSIAYIDMWKRITVDCFDTAFWSYTKNAIAENAFDNIENINIVKSIINIENVKGFNFGKIEYVLKVYHALKELGKDVYICRCGIDENQHCVDCKGCSVNKYVLFVEHSTGYNAKKDPLYNELVKVIESQPKV